MKVKEISSTQVPDISNKRVAAYARVSTETELQCDSLSAQVDYYEKYIKNHTGWELVEIYADKGISGTQDNRPQFQRMLEDCRNGKIDLIVTKAVSRFARNTITLVETMRELRTMGIDIYFETERLHSISESGDLMIRLLSMMAEDYSRSLSENVKWGIQKMFESGRANGGGRFLGYRWRKNSPVIIPEEAKIVQQIYTDYLSGMTAVDIAKKLNMQGIKTITGINWKDQAVRKILRNEKYMGDMLLQKTYTENYRTHKEIINKGQRRQYYVENSHEAIISKKEFQTVQKEFAWRRRHKAGVEAPYKYPYSGLITCANCGQRFWHKKKSEGTKYGKPIWHCSTFFRKGKAVCNMRFISDLLLVVLTQEALGLESLEGVNIRDYINQIICDREGVTFKLKNGDEKYLLRRRLPHARSKANKG